MLCRVLLDINRCKFNSNKVCLIVQRFESLGWIYRRTGLLDSGLVWLSWDTLNGVDHQHFGSAGICFKAENPIEHIEITTLKHANSLKAFFTLEML